MDSSESISFSMDTTTDSIDVRNHFSSKFQDTTARQSPSKQQSEISKRPLLQVANNDSINRSGETTSNNTSSVKEEFIVVDETPPPSAESSTSLSASSTSISSSSASISHSIATADYFSTSSQPEAVVVQDIKEAETSNLVATLTSSVDRPKKKSVLFDKVTVYHFNRSQGFTSIPSQGGSTLGMKRRHFLRRRLSVDLYEEVRRRSRREILLKIRMEKRKQEEQGAYVSDIQNQSLAKDCISSSRIIPNIEQFTTPTNAQKRDPIGRDDDEENEDESLSGYSDISDSELEHDSYIFLQPISIKLRRSLLRASGVCRIDPGEKRECNRIRNSRERSGCRCEGRCIPNYCECSRYGVKCHVDRASFPCGCTAEGCTNPEGRTEFDIARVRNHYVKKVIEAPKYLYKETDDNSSGEQSDGSTIVNASHPQESC